jgi:hypothetical protein
MVLKVSVDGGVEIDDGAKDATPETTAGSAQKKVSTALSQEPEVGVKWNTQRG